MATAASFPQIFGKYTLLSHLATGGMAQVYLAKQRGPSGFEKELVIKRILPHLASDPSFVQMFLAEATLAARVNHPNIAHIYELGDHEGDYYIAMEYVAGITLEKILDLARERGQTGLPWPIAVRIIASAAEGLDHAHKARDGEGRLLQLVHRDVSPSNIMVNWEGVAKILDFGIAKSQVVDDDTGSGLKVRTGVGVLKGKLPYMSPEQLQGLELDARSDIFSLGSVLYEMICGQRPFPGDSMAQLTVQILSREPTSPELLAPSFPDDLKPILWKTLSKSVAERYQSARDLRQDLEQFLADQHVSCSNYDIEAYLRELVPDRTPFMPVLPRHLTPGGSRRSSPSTQSPPHPTPEAALPVQQRDSMSTHPAPTGSGHEEKSGRLGPLDHHGLDLDAEERRQKRDKGGSPVVMIVIAALVLITGAVFYVLHERAVDRSQQPTTPRPAEPTSGSAAAPAAAPASPPPASPATPPPAAAAGTPPPPATAPAAPASGKAGKEPAKDTKEAKDTKAGKEPAKDAAKPGEGDAKPEKHRSHHKSEDSGDAPRALPHLPVPPPADPE